MPLDQPGVKIPDERLYTYTDDDIEAFIEEASRFVRRHKHSRETNVEYLAHVYRVLRKARKICTERQASNRIVVVDHAQSTAQTMSAGSSPHAIYIYTC